MAPPAADRRHRILVADDEESMRYFVQRGLARHGYEVVAADGGAAAIELGSSQRFDVAVLDLKMPGTDGLQVLAELRGRDPDVLVVMMTGHATIATAVEAMRLGAWDYITKPFEIEELTLVVERALSHRRALRGSRDYDSLVDRRQAHAGLIGQSVAMKQVYQAIDRLGATEASVLLRGESGTGKELVARALHASSSRRDGPFVALHCAAMPEKLLENELFGHEPGAFTGATDRKAGLLARSDGGTLFLDEVGDIPLPLQVKLERFLQEREFRPLGSEESQSVDVRVIAATNRDLEQAVEDGGFRQELFYRLNVVPLVLPPLRQRREDVPLMAQHFLARFRPEGSPLERFTADALVVLGNHSWPGNVRELENAVERVVALHADAAEIDVADLPAEVRGGDGPAQRLLPDASMNYQDAMAAFERIYFEQLLEQAGGNISECARLAGLSRGHLHRKIRQLEIDAEGFRS